MFFILFFFKNLFFFFFDSYKHLYIIYVNDLKKYNIIDKIRRFSCPKFLKKNALNDIPIIPLIKTKTEKTTKIAEPPFLEQLILTIKFLL